MPSFFVNVFLALCFAATVSYFSTVVSLFVLYFSFPLLVSLFNFCCSFVVFPDAGVRKEFFAKGFGSA